MSVSNIVTIINLKKGGVTMKYEFITHNPGVDSIESARAGYTDCKYECAWNVIGYCQMELDDPTIHHSAETARMNNLYWNLV